MKQISSYAQRESSEINKALEAIPKAELWQIKAVKPVEDALEFVDTKRFLAVVVDKKIVSTVTPKYVLVQSADAFRPVVEGVTLAGVQDFKFSLLALETKAYLNLLVTDADGIKIGFRVSNSIDGKSALRYGFDMERRVKENVLIQDHIVTVWGVRQICANGMKIRVPLAWKEVVREVERIKILELFSESTRLEHIGNVADKVKAMQFVAEAFIYMREPVKRILNLAKKFSIEDREIAKKLISKYVGRRIEERILNRFDQEEDSLWGLYNACTYVASHDGLSVSTNESLLNKSAVMLERELRAGD